MRPPAAVAAAVERVADGRGRTVAALELRPSSYRTSTQLDEIDVGLDDGTVLALMLKHVGALSDAARRTKPTFALDGDRELEVYASVVGGSGRWAPRCLAADPHEGWLLLERVRGVELYQLGELEAWQAAARHTAAMHAEVGPRATADPPRSLLHYDRDFFAAFARRAAEFGRAPQLEPLLAGYDEVAGRLAALPRTFVHGELYASNVLVEHGGNGIRVVPVDWEMAGLGPAMLDLAALTSGGWGDAERRAIAGAYGPHDEEALELCRLHLAVQWLGWAPDWQPPAEHAHDWTADAIAAAGKLGL